MSEKFEVGDKVKWTSSGKTGVKEKTGEVVCVVPAGKQFVVKNLPKDCQGLRRLFDGIVRPEQSYIVKVVPGSTGRAAPILYWPRVQHLERA